MQCELVWVEKNSKSAHIASTRFDVVEEDAFSYVQGPAQWLNDADIILMVDVLEHLYEPADFLHIIRERMKIDSTLILVLPNIESYEIIDMLISNKFAYADSGILDRTHRYFYSPKSCCSELNKIGFGLKSKPIFLRNEKGNQIFEHYMQTKTISLSTSKEFSVIHLIMKMPAPCQAIALVYQ